MERTRMELLPGVWLTAVRDRTRETATLRVALLSQLTQEAAGLNALLPDVLLAGSAQHPGEALKDCFRADGGELLPLVRKYGEVQAVGLIATAKNDAAALEAFAQRFAEALLSPDTHFGQLSRDAVEQALAAREERTDDDYDRLIAHLCAFEDFAIPAYGETPDAGPNFYQKLTKHWRQWLSTSPVELYYCGAAPAKEAARVLTDAFVALPRGEIEYDLGTDIRMNAVEETPRVLDASDPEGVKRLLLGWRLGDAMEDPDPAALGAAACVVQYLARGMEPELRLDIHKGLLLARCDTAITGPDLARDALLEVIEVMKEPAFSPAALDEARKGRIAALMALAGDDLALEDFWLGQTLLGLDEAPDETAAFLEEAAMADVVQTARSLVCDAILLL